MRSQDRFGLRMLLGEDCRNVGLQNSGLLGRNLLDRVAEKYLMVEIDRRNHAQLRHHDVGGIQPPAQPHFQHSRVHLLGREDHKRHGGHGLKVRRMHVKRARRDHTFRGLMNSHKRIRELLLAHLATGDLNSLGGLH